MSNVRKNADKQKGASISQLEKIVRISRCATAAQHWRMPTQRQTWTFTAIICKTRTHPAVGPVVSATLGLGTAMMMNMLPTAMMAAITGQWIIMTVVAGGGVESVKKTARLLVTLSEIAKQSTTRQTVVASPAKVISGDHTLLVALVDSRSRIPSVMPRKL